MLGFVVRQMVLLVLAPAAAGTGGVSADLRPERLRRLLLQEGVELGFDGFRQVEVRERLVRNREPHFPIVVVEVRLADGGEGVRLEDQHAAALVELAR